jgi:hypothetical protein
MQQASDLVAECAAASMWQLTEDDLVAFLDAMHRVQQMARAAVLHAVREVEGRGIPRAQHAATTNVWLRGRLRISASEAGRLMRQARLLDTDPDLDAAVTRGDVNAEQLSAIAAALDDLPHDLDPGIRGKARAALVDWARELDPVDLRRVGARILTHVAPEVFEAAEEARLEAEERRAREQRYFVLVPLGDGRVRVRGTLDTQAAEVVRAALDPLCRPGATPVGLAAARPTVGLALGGPAKAGLAGSGAELAGSELAGSELAGSELAGSGAAGSGAAGADDERTVGQRRADALVEVCRLSLAGGGLPDNGGDRPQLSVTASFDVLNQKLGTGVTDTGEPVSASAVRRMACDARLLPYVLGGESQILDAGRARRLVSGSLRRALGVRDGGCTFPGCDRPPRWCDAHHIVSWADGGPTDLSNLALLCEYHHQIVHSDAGWRVKMGADDHPEFLPPSWFGPEGLPRRNRYHRRT